MHFKKTYLVVCLLFTAVMASAQTGPAAAPGLDGKFVQLSNDVPGFGGYFFDDDGDLNVYLTGRGNAQAARAALAQVARDRAERSHQPWSRPAEIIVRRGDFDFAQLDAWRGRLTAAAAAIAGVHLLDTDETINRIFIGVEDEDSKSKLLSRLGALGVPESAVIVDVMAAATPITSLRDNVRPLVGGLHIDWSYASGTASYCTLGANVWYTNVAQGIATGTLGFMTASHCSDVYGGTDGTVYSQGGTRIGYERWDPPFFTNAVNTRCPAGRNCRWSDTAFVQYDAGVDRYQGGLAHTGYRGFNNWNAGSIDFNASYPTFRIIGTATPVVGNYLDKVGRTTGWTTGQVSRTCADILSSGNRAFLCQDEVEAFADYGDSGSPVFRFDGGTDASFAGILWAKTSDGGFLFSNKGRIEADLGGAANYKWY